MPSKHNPDPEHGTRARYLQHFRENTEPCAKCKTANSESMREYRTKNPRSNSQHADDMKIRRRALVRLKNEYPARYEELVREEMIQVMGEQQRGESDV